MNANVVWDMKLLKIEKPVLTSMNAWSLEVVVRNVSTPKDLSNVFVIKVIRWKLIRNLVKLKV